MYWLSYIDALIKLGKLEDAKAVFDQGQAIKPDYGNALINMGNAFKEQGTHLRRLSRLTTKRGHQA